jgi:hypothetical protein
MKQPLELVDEGEGAFYRRQLSQNTYDEWHPTPEVCVKHEARGGGGVILHLPVMECEDIAREYETQDTQS